jgi:hypothetical protein
VTIRWVERFGAVRQRLAGDPARTLRSAATLLAIGLLVGFLLFVLGPMLADFSTYGFHDWDSQTAYRYITVLSAKRGEGPWWHPWLCGGVPAFGYSEGATNFLSPYLPFYLWADLRTALRVEVLGQGLLALAGSYAFASVLTSSVALRALLAALFVFNGRWALQAAVGHTWHLQYAFMPWAFHFFERSLAPGSWRFAFAAGAALAACCFFGGIYPLPHTALLLVLYACLRGVFDRSWQPLRSLVVTGASAIGLSAPKLFAVIDQMRVIPRLIDSKEVIGFSELLAMLVAPDQRYGVHPVPVPAYNWHEWGIYVGTGGLLLLFAAVVFPSGSRALAYKILGLLCLFLGFGAFHADAPWPLLHRLPLFSSQHVPSRFFYPMLLMLGAAFVAYADGWVAPRLAKRPWLDLVLLAPVALFAWDMARFSRTPFEQAFWMTAPPGIRRAELFEQHSTAPVQYERRDWAQPMLLSMYANMGVTHCYGVDPNFVSKVIPVGASDYRGLVFLEGEGQARVTDWTPNHAVVEVAGAQPGDLLVYDMNYDASWRADGEAALEVDGLVATRLKASQERVEFRYFPRTFAWSLPLFALTLAVCLGLWRPASKRLLSGLPERLARFFDRKPPA